MKQFPLNSNIKAIDLSFTDITDDALDHLSGMKQLKHLYVGGTKVTKGGINRSRAARPDLVISLDN